MALTLRQAFHVLGFITFFLGLSFIMLASAATGTPGAFVQTFFAIFFIYLLLSLLIDRVGLAKTRNKALIWIIVILLIFFAIELFNIVSSVMIETPYLPTAQYTGAFIEDKLLKLFLIFIASLIVFAPVYMTTDFS